MFIHLKKMYPLRTYVLNFVAFKFFCSFSTTIVLSSMFVKENFSYLFLKLFLSLGYIKLLERYPTRIAYSCLLALRRHLVKFNFVY